MPSQSSYRQNFLKLVLVLTSSFFLLACGESDSPDTILINGTVLTIDATDSITEAVAITGDRISHVGTTQDLLKLATEQTEIVDLQGKTLIPGFVGAHEHPTLSAVFSGLTDLSGFSHESADAMWNKLQQTITNTPKGEWVFGMGLDPVIMPDLVLPDRQQLDTMSPDNPLLIISQTMHSFWANSAAFEELGIDRNTPDPGMGGYYGKDADGELNGFISESAVDPFLENLKSPLRVVNGYEQALQSLLESGFTSVASLGFNVPPLIARYASSDNFNARIRQFIYLRTDELDYLPDTPDNGDDFYRILGIKLWHDGSPYTGSMYLNEPYLDNELTRMMGIPANHVGEPVISSAEFVDQITSYHQQGWQLAVHSQGDRSNELSVAAFRDALGNATKGSRHRFEHSLLLPSKLLPEFKKMGLSPSFHINHIYYYGDALRDSIIGPDRAERVLPVKSAFDMNLHPTLHADSPMFPTDAFSLMKTAVTRQTQSGKTLGLDQAINIQQALRAMTINAAWQLQMDDKIGSIEVGKYADLTVLSGNPYQLPADEWLDINIEQVWLAGDNRLD